MARSFLFLSFFSFHFLLIFCSPSLFLRTTLSLLSASAPLHEHRDAKSCRRITRNPTTLWSVDGSTEAFIGPRFGFRLMALWIQIRRVFTPATTQLLHFTTSFLNTRASAYLPRCRDFDVISGRNEVELVSSKVLRDAIYFTMR